MPDIAVGWRGQLIENIHDSTSCYPGVCPFHNPSSHALRNAPLYVDNSYVGTALVFRVCQHDSPHVDPDSRRWFLRQTGTDVHCDGCCGCCQTSVDQRRSNR